MYIYIYIYAYIHVYIYIYIYVMYIHAIIESLLASCNVLVTIRVQVL